LSDEDRTLAPAHRLVGLLRRRELGARELIEAVLARTGRLNPALNAVVTSAAERALAEADDADRRLAGGDGVRLLEGLPVTIKDSFATADVRSTAGSRVYENLIPKRDAPLVARLREAGAIVVGKTNLPELGLDYDCENPLFGRTVNPWNPDLVPGGSSGGEAAALATGLSALGLGSDYGGSIRLPAACCGIAGLRPTVGALPPNAGLREDPVLAPPQADMLSAGPMARSVDDLALAFEVMRGVHPDSPQTVPAPGADPDAVALEGLGCAIFAELGDAPLEAALGDAARRAGEALADAGLAVTERTPPIDDAHDIWAAYATADGRKLLRELLGENVQLLREQARCMVLADVPERSASGAFRIMMDRDRLRVRLAHFMEDHPVIVCPPFAVGAFPHGTETVTVEGVEHRLAKLNWPAVWVSCAGLPAAVVPAGRDVRGMPVAVQVVGRPFDESTVLAVARILERRLGGWAPRTCSTRCARRRWSSSARP